MAVVVRVRPPAAGERAAQQPLLRVVDHKTLVFDPEGLGGAPGPALPARGTKHPGRQHKFVFDRVFGEQAGQEEVFQHTTRGMVGTVLAGYNCSGKRRQSAWVLPAAAARLALPGLGSAEPALVSEASSKACPGCTTPSASLAPQQLRAGRWHRGRLLLALWRSLSRCRLPLCHALLPSWARSSSRSRQ